MTKGGPGDPAEEPNEEASIPVVGTLVVLCILLLKSTQRKVFKKQGSPQEDDKNNKAGLLPEHTGVGGTRAQALPRPALPTLPHPRG